jgi:hypothetical protein
MSRSLFRFTVGSILLGCSAAAAQAQSSRAYPMNTEDRINATHSRSDDWGYDDNERPIGAAGAYPMNTMDRINGAWKASNRPLRQPAATKSAAVQGAGNSGGVVTTMTSLKDRPDAWRYRWHRNQWWYYGTDNHWSYWSGNHWNAYADATKATAD